MSHYNSASNNEDNNNNNNPDSRITPAHYQSSSVEMDRDRIRRGDSVLTPPPKPLLEGTVKELSKHTSSPRKWRRRRNHTESYGTIENKAPYRSISMPVHRREKVFIAKRSNKIRTIGEQSAKLVEEAKRNFFHGSFSSSHGAMFLVPPKMVGSFGAPSFSRSASRGSHKGRAYSPTGKRKIVPDTSHQHQKGSENIITPTGYGKEMQTVYKNANELGNGSFFSSPVVLHPRSHSAGHPTRAFVNYQEGKHTTYREGMTTYEDGNRSPSDYSNKEPHQYTFTLGEELSKIHGNYFSQTKMSSVATDEFISCPDDGSTAMSSNQVAQEIRKAPKKVQISTLLQEINHSDILPSTLIWKDGDLRTGGIADPLLKRDETHPEKESEEDEFASEEDVIPYSEALMETLRLAAPAAVNICFTFCMSVIPLAFVGSLLGDRQLTGASVGYFIIGIFILYPMIGLTFAMDTLCSHEYGRDPLSSGQGLLLQRGILINLVVLIPLFWFMSRLHGILVWIYGPQVAAVASEFLTFAPLFLLAIMLFIAFNKFLTNQMQPQMPMIALTAGILITPLVQSQLTPLGVKFTMLGMAITAWFQLLVLIVMTLFKPSTRQTLGTLRLREALMLEDVKAYLELAIPSAIFVAAEASSFDVTVLLVAKFGENEGAAWSGIMNILYIFGSFSGGLSASACANIGRCIGANEPLSARRFLIVTISAVVILSLVDSITLVVFFDYFMSFFGAAGKTLEIAHRALFLLPFLHIADAVQFAFQGIFSGIGKNHVGALILLLSLWGIGVPLAFLLGDYLGYSLFGSCLGLTIGLCIEAPCMIIYTFFIDYDQICEQFFSESDDDDEEETEDEECEVDYDSDEEEEEEENEGENDEFAVGDENYVVDKDVLRRSGISTRRNEFDQCYSQGCKRKSLLPPKRSGANE